MKNKKVRVLTGSAMLTAVAFALQFIEISIPIIPSFIKLDFSDLPALIGAFAYGPLAGVLIQLLKNLIHMPFGSSMFIGELSNFLHGAVFVLAAGFIYKHKKTKANAVFAGFIGSLAMAAVCLPLNYFVVYPLYYSVLGLPEEAVLGMYQAILPSVKNMVQALAIFNIPFTFVKAFICAVVSILIYKPLSPLLKGKTQN
ncbi:MAG: ECF transporter S component [Clostridium sp.]|nr:ECF transporter S component [Clostridium sp.]